MQLNLRNTTIKATISAALEIHTGTILYYDKALAINPKDETTLYNKGLALENLGNYTEAIKYFDKALAIDSHYVRALTDKGISLGDSRESYWGYRIF